MTGERENTPSMGRRRWLALAGGSASLALAGCLGSDDDDDDDDAPTDPEDDADDSQPGDDVLHVTLTNLTIGDAAHGETVDLSVGTDHPITATVASDTDDTRQALVDVAVYAVGDADEFPAPGDEEAIDAVVTDRSPVATDSQRVDADPDSQYAVEFEGLTEELAGGLYVAVVSIDDADTRAATPLTVVDTAEVPVDVYTVEAADGSRPESGTLFLEATFEDASLDPIQQELADLAEEPSPTVELPLGLPTESVELVARDVDDNLYPPGSVEVPLEREPEPVEIVAGYEFQGSDAYRFSYYMHYFTASHPPYREYIYYGTHAANGDFNGYLTSGTRFEDELFGDVDGTPPEYGADLEALVDEEGYASVRHSVELDGEAFFYSGIDEEWQPDDEASGRDRSTHLIVKGGLDEVTEPTPEEREFRRREQYRDRTVDVYRITGKFGDSTYADDDVYVDPETGHILRIERDPLGAGEEFPDSVEVAEFFDHGEPETADIEFLQERSVHETGQGLDELPWE